MKLNKYQKETCDKVAIYKARKRIVTDTLFFFFILAPLLYILMVLTCV